MSFIDQIYKHLPRVEYSQGIDNYSVLKSAMEKVLENGDTQPPSGRVISYSDFETVCEIIRYRNKMKKELRLIRKKKVKKLKYGDLIQKGFILVNYNSEIYKVPDLDKCDPPKDGSKMSRAYLQELEFRKMKKADAIFRNFEMRGATLSYIHYPHFPIKNEKNSLYIDPSKGLTGTLSPKWFKKPIHTAKNLIVDEVISSEVIEEEVTVYFVTAWSKQKLRDESRPESEAKVIAYDMAYLLYGIGNSKARALSSLKKARESMISKLVVEKMRILE